MSCPKCNPLPPESANLSTTMAVAQTHRVYLPKRDTTNVVLVGNPNVGKSSLFNTLTGMHQTVVNAPGTTVEVFTGFNKSLGVRFIDTPERTRWCPILLMSPWWFKLWRDNPVR